MKKPEHKKADDLMSQYATLNQQRQDLLDTIMPELKVIEEGMKEKQLKLIEIGEANKESFDNGNLHFTDGYLHIAKSAVIETHRNFDLATFAEAKPDMIEVTLKVKPIKEAFLDSNQRKELKTLGVSVNSSEKVEVKLSKKK